MPLISCLALIFLFSYQSQAEVNVARLLDVISSVLLTFAMAAALIRLRGSALGW